MVARIDDPRLERAAAGRRPSAGKRVLVPHQLLPAATAVRAGLGALMGKGAPSALKGMDPAGMDPKAMEEAARKMGLGGMGGGMLPPGLGGFGKKK